jgi:hypothetical protein
VFLRVRVAQFIVFGVVFGRPIFVLLRFTDSDYTFGIFKLFLYFFLFLLAMTLSVLLAMTLSVLSAMTLSVLLAMSLSVFFGYVFVCFFWL